MDRVGGYSELLLLEQDARRYDDVTIVIEAESRARKLAELKARASRGGE